MIYYWTIYAVFCIVHLILCFKEKENVRKITKIFIIPMLVLGLVLHQTFNLLLYIGLILGWIGDVCLIFTSKKRYFVIGAISFCLGHISYVIATLALFLQKHSINDIPIFVYLLLTIIAILFIILTKLRIRKHLGLISYLGSFYFYIIVIAIFTSFLTKMYILSIGFAIFIISDSILSICRFHHPIKRQHFFIMSTYIVAQTLITLSFIYY